MINNIKAGHRDYSKVGDYCMASKIVARPFKAQRSGRSAHFRSI